MSNNKIVVEIWGDFGLFTRPDMHLERVSYDMITPSAARNILESIYYKYTEFYYQIEKIEVLNPIKTISIKKNEVRSKAKVSGNKIRYINTTDSRTQRNSVYLRDVRYRITASIHIRDNVKPHVNVKSLTDQCLRRIEKGKCFSAPFLGTRECMCFFSPPDYNNKPIQVSKDLGIMLYDVFDFTKINPVLNTTRGKENGLPNVTFFDAKLIDGVLFVPEYNSSLVYKLGGQDVSTII